MLTVTTMIVTAALSTAPRAQTPAAANASTCLHAPGTEAPDQAIRTRQALGLTRTINSAEAGFRAKAGTGGYGDLGQLVAYQFLKPPPAGGEYVPGFDLHLDLTGKGYWFSVVDTTDACGFRFISNQDGLIFTAEPIR
jgi:hypothetical protein